MLDSFIFVVLPYTALALVLFVVPYRYVANRLTWTTYSTQFLERDTLYWGSMSWHHGIILILFAHLAGIVWPGGMQRLLGNQQTLVVLESIGVGLGLLALFGTLVLLLRRVNSGMLKRVTFAADWVLLWLLIFQAASGVYVGLFMRWGSLWYLYTAVPYLRSLLAFRPQVEYLADFPLLFKLHAAGAFLIIALLPFTKLVHLLFVPFRFLADAPILYRWRSR
ncbi:MAG TPA: respiratory nitrate reductase subunit gamma [Desulfuromonadaceae bacterium]